MEDVYSDWLIKELNILRSDIIDGKDWSNHDIVGLIGESIERMTSLDLQRKLRKLEQLEAEISEGKRPLLPFSPGEYCYQAEINQYTGEMCVIYEPYVAVPVSDWYTNGEGKCLATADEAHQWLLETKTKLDREFPNAPWAGKEFKYKKYGYDGYE